jgi:hypothetical protein
MSNPLDSGAKDFNAFCVSNFGVEYRSLPRETHNVTSLVPIPIDEGDPATTVAQAYELNNVVPAFRSIPNTSGYRDIALAIWDIQVTVSSSLSRTTAGDYLAILYNTGSGWNAINGSWINVSGDTWRLRAFQSRNPLIISTSSTLDPGPPESGPFGAFLASLGVSVSVAVGSSGGTKTLSAIKMNLVRLPIAVADDVSSGTFFVPFARRTTTEPMFLKYTRPDSETPWSFSVVDSDGTAADEAVEDSMDGSGVLDAYKDATGTVTVTL